MQSQQSRDLLYETKKSFLERGGREDQPSELFENPKKEIDDLRAQLRRRQTDIIRLKSRVEELQSQLKAAQSSSKKSHALVMDETKKNSEEMGKVNFIAENKSLRDQCADLQNEVFALNGIKNELERSLRQTRAELEGNSRKLRELQIIEQMRQERFEDELRIAKDALAKVDPPIDEDIQLREGARQALDFLRSGLCQSIFDIFINSANQSQQRKTTSLIVFRSSLNELRKSRRNCVLLSCRTHQQFQKVVKLYDPQYGEAEIDINQQPRNKLNKWLSDSIVEVTKGSKDNHLEELEMKLFRLLALYYRVKYPLKGEQNLQIDQDLEVKLETLVCEGLLRVLIA